MSDVFLLFIDDYSRFSWLYLLKTKDEALSIFLQFKNLVENQFDAKIKILQTDWGGRVDLSPLSWLLVVSLIESLVLILSNKMGELREKIVMLLKWD